MKRFRNKIVMLCYAEGKVSIKFSYFLNVFEQLLSYCCFLKHVLIFIVVRIEFDSHSSASFQRSVALFSQCPYLISEQKYSEIPQL
jgi:hypothetical protein